TGSRAAPPAEVPLSEAVSRRRALGELLRGLGRLCRGNRPLQLLEEPLLVAESVHDLAVLQTRLPGHRRQGELAALGLELSGRIDGQLNGLFLGDPAPDHGPA